MKLVYVAALSIVAMVAAPRSSFAQQAPTKASADAEASAREHFQRGQRLSARGEYAAAYREFAAGYALSERPLFLFNMAEAARANGDIAKARDNYQRFVQVDPNNPLVATARTRLASLDPPAATTPSGEGPAGPGTSPTAPAVTTVPFGPNPEAPRPMPPPWTAPASPPLTPAPSERIALAPIGAPAPLWKKWPFWAVVGGVLITGSIVYAVSRDEPRCGDGCTQINFR
jgi:tetratricopeptide (TPR) repeat protein